MQLDAFETRVLLLAGELTVADAVKSRPTSIQRVTAILGCATLLEDDRDIELAIDH